MSINPETHLNFDRKKSDLETIFSDERFTSLLGKRITHRSRKGQLYFYSSESVNDTSWGCGWRAIQTLLSPYYSELNREVPDFRRLYQSYGSRDFLTKEYALHYPNGPQDWLSPHESYYMWADPFIGHMIAKSLGLSSTLLILHGCPETFSPAIGDRLISFSELRGILEDHFNQDGYPVMIDNGQFAMNIIGVGKEKDNLLLLISDPHLRFDRDEQLLNGIYLIELDDQGNQIDRIYPEEDNHDSKLSYQSLSFKDSKWLFLTVK